MSAAARAEARRKAILSRGTDRLAKLTTSGRGEDAAYAPEVADPPLPTFPTSAPTNLGNFVGEETPMPRPRSRVPSRTNANANGATQANPSNPFGMPDPSAWSAEQQTQFLQALMGGGGSPPSMPALTSGAGAGLGGSPAPEANPFAGMGMENNPFAAMMAAAAGGGGGAGFPPMGADAGMPGMGMGMGKAPEMTPPKTLAQRLMPALHLIAVWTLLLYFVFVQEPATHDVTSGGVGEPGGIGFAWRWRQLIGGAKGGLGAFASGWGVHALPFFWAFVTLELVLHSLRIFSGFDAFRPPTLLALALPHLPPPIPSVIVHSMKYLQMGSMFLDDIAAVIVGIGLVIWLATWRAA
ncbi:hypothetical protein B0H19DRAFT_1257055 [Mycena capillaripes]|nr:hypothetical protein B0H19DRAFT_1257055 [Mycena capillaripes]